MQFHGSVTLDNGMPPADQATQSCDPVLYKRWIPPLVILAAFLIFTWSTWAHWGNLRVDCGREMYVPQQLASGKMLYRDLWYPYGPMAPYWNAFLFQIFGTHLHVLYASGLAITLGFAFTLYAIGRRFIPTAASLLAVLCLFAQAFQPGLFNYILPYSYAATMGAFLAFLFLLFFLRSLENKTHLDLLIAGLAAGLALATKVEFGVACYLTFVFSRSFQSYAQRSLRALFDGLTPFLLGLCIPLAVSAYFIRRLSLSFFLNDYYSTQFYVQYVKRQGLRFEPSEVLRQVLEIGISLIFWFLAPKVLKFFVIKEKRRLALRVFLGGLLLAVVYLKWWAFSARGSYYLWAGLIRFVAFPQGLYWLVCIALVVLFLRVRRSSVQSGQLSLAALCFFALFVGLRIISQAEAANYAIYYNTALFLIFLLVIYWIIDRATLLWLPWQRTTAVMILFVLEGGFILGALNPWRALPPVPLRTAQGVIYAPWGEASAFNEAIRFLDQKKAEGKRVLILPEETSLYFFTGLTAPSRWYMVHPGLLDNPSREQLYIRQVEDFGVDYVMLSNRTNREYGFPFFGLDYNHEVYEWIQTHFELIGECGRFSRTNPWELGFLIYQRRD